MIKNLSIAFVFLMTSIVIASILSLFLPSKPIIVMFINICAIGLLIIGIALIVTLIIDRYRDYKNENDDYKKY